jgi:hypothetical protein
MDARDDPSASTSAFHAGTNSVVASGQSRSCSNATGLELPEKGLRSKSRAGQKGPRVHREKFCAVADFFRLLFFLEIGVLGER